MSHSRGYSWLDALFALIAVIWIIFFASWALAQTPTAITPKATVSLADQVERRKVEFPIIGSDGTPIPDTHAVGLHFGNGLTTSLENLTVNGRNQPRVRIDAGATSTPAPTNTPGLTFTPTHTWTPGPTPCDECFPGWPSATPDTPSATPTIVPTATQTPTVSPTWTPVLTPCPNCFPGFPTLTPTSATSTPTNTAVNTPTPTPTCPLVCCFDGDDTQTCNYAGFDCDCAANVTPIPNAICMDQGTPVPVNPFDGGSGPCATLTPTITPICCYQAPTLTPTPTVTNTASTFTPTSLPTATNTPTVTLTSTPSNTIPCCFVLPTLTPTHTHTNTPTGGTLTPTPTPTQTGTPTQTFADGIVFVDGAVMATDGANLDFDNTNDTMGLGTTASTTVRFTLLGKVGASANPGANAPNVANVTGGAGGAAASGNNNGGTGGGQSVTMGAGGAQSGSGTGGTGGAFSLTCGTGGSAATGIGGTGGTCTFSAGNGGTGGAAAAGPGGNFIIRPGSRGAGADFAGTIVLDGVVSTDDVNVAIPTLGACGTTPSIAAGSSNFAGKVTVGTGVTTSCSVAFTRTFGAAPACVCNNSTSVLSVRCTASTTGLVMVSTASFASDVLQYICVGLNGG